MVENMTEREFVEFLACIEMEIDKKCGPLDWIDLTAWYEERRVSWAWSNTNLDQTDEEFFDQCRKIVELVTDKNDDYRAELICYPAEEIDACDGVRIIEAEAVINARFDGGELHEDQ